jgi:hypothetical protein
VTDERYVTPFAVICEGTVTGTPCREGRPLCISEKAYMSQLFMAHVRWKCPMCGGNASWDDNCPHALSMEDEP